MISLSPNWKKSYKKFTVVIAFLYFLMPIIHRLIDDLNNAGVFGLDKQDAVRGGLATAVYIASIIKQSGLIDDAKIKSNNQDEETK